MSAGLVGALVAELAALSDAELAPLVERLVPLLAAAATPRPAPAPLSPYLSPDEAAELLRCRKRRVYELVGDRRLTRHGDGRRLLVSRAEVAKLAAGQ